VGVANPTCVLATAADVEALRWVEANTAPEASFLINSRRWQGETIAGTDAGYWLPALAGRRASAPPLPYAHASPDDVRRVEALGERLTTPPEEDAAEIRRLALAEGYDHVFIGALGGPLHKETFLDAPGYRLEFTNGSAWVFQVLPD
jgi:hypothetical protein